MCNGKYGRYAMREALAISSEEGLKKLWQRHENMHHMLWDGLKSMGLKSFVENDSERLITVNTITVKAILSVDVKCLLASSSYPICTRYVCTIVQNNSTRYDSPKLRLFSEVTLHSA